MTISTDLPEDFLEHYYTYWASRIAPEVTLGDEDRAVKTNLVISYIAEACEKLRADGIQTDQFVAFVFRGKGAANGHVFVDAEGNVHPWFAIECFDSELEARVFVMHEIVHALHYSFVPDFYFITVNEKELVWRQLLTEGIATFVTRQLLNLSDAEALWADALPKRDLSKWMADCHEAEAELARRVLSTFDLSDNTSSLFHAADPDDIYAFRAGYFLGLRIIDKIAAADNWQLNDLLTAPSSSLRQRARQILISMAD